MLGDAASGELIEKYCPKTEVQKEQTDSKAKIPQFPGGENALINYLSKNIKYPRSARENNIKGTVFISFVINRNGGISAIKVLKGIGGGCDEEAVRVILQMPLWEIGLDANGNPVEVMYNLPIRFWIGD